MHEIAQININAKCTHLGFFYHWSFDRKTLLDDEAKAQKLISVKSAHFSLEQLISTQIFIILGIGD